jgi:hypothetical protein
MGAKLLLSVRGFVRGAAGDFCAVSAGTYEARGTARSTFVTTRLNDDVGNAAALRRAFSVPVTRARFSITDDLRWKKDEGVNADEERPVTVRFSGAALKSGALDEVRRV